jgi:hypothetical protein
VPSQIAHAQLEKTKGRKKKKNNNERRRESRKRKRQMQRLIHTDLKHVHRDVERELHGVTRSSNVFTVRHYTHFRRTPLRFVGYTLLVRNESNFGNGLLTTEDIMKGTPITQYEVSTMIVV